MCDSDDLLVKIIFSESADDCICIPLKMSEINVIDEGIKNLMRAFFDSEEFIDIRKYGTKANTEVRFIIYIECGLCGEEYPIGQVYSVYIPDKSGEAIQRFEMRRLDIDYASSIEAMVGICIISAIENVANILDERKNPTLDSVDPRLLTTLDIWNHRSYIRDPFIIWQSGEPGSDHNDDGNNNGQYNDIEVTDQESDDDDIGDLETEEASCWPEDFVDLLDLESALGVISQVGFSRD